MLAVGGYIRQVHHVFAGQMLVELQILLLNLGVLRDPDIIFKPLGSDAACEAVPKGSLYHTRVVLPSRQGRNELIELRWAHVFLSYPWTGVADLRIGSMRHASST
jgi:hypothetical protein